MIEHLSSYATDFGKTRGFYDAVLPSLGFDLQTEMSFDSDEEFPGRRACAWGPPGRTTYWVIEVKTPFEPRHVAFAAADRQAVDRFHAVGLLAGGQDNGAPGVREIYHPNYYGSFLLDPDGNNVEAVCHSAPGDSSDN